MLRPNVQGIGKRRQGKGFSAQEVEKAGLTWHQARLLQVPIDRRRETVHADNIEVLSYLKAEAQKAAAAHARK